MKINKPSKKRTTLIASSVIGVLLIGSVVFALQQANDNPPNNAELTEATDNTSAVQESQIQNEEAREDSASLPSKSPQNSNQSDTSNPSTNETANTTPEKPQVSRAGQSGEVIKVVALFQQESSGYCELELAKDNTPTVSRDSPITVGPAYYACSFEVPTDQLVPRGTWNVTVVHHIGGSSTKSNTTKIEIN